MIIGIDPDVDKSGVAKLINGKIEYNTLSFFDLTELLIKLSDEIKCVYLEAGWLNKSIHHFAENKAIAGKIGTKVGANHTIGKLLNEYMQRNGIKCVLVRPTKSKLKSDHFKKLTNIQTRTNQEERDSIMLVWGR